MLLFLGLVMGVVFVRVHPLISTILYGLTLPGLLVFLYYQFAANGRWLSLLLPASTLSLSYMSIMIGGSGVNSHASPRILVEDYPVSIKFFAHSSTFPCRLVPGFRQGILRFFTLSLPRLHWFDHGSVRSRSCDFWFFQQVNKCRVWAASKEETCWQNHANNQRCHLKQDKQPVIGPSHKIKPHLYDIRQMSRLAVCSLASLSCYWWPRIVTSMKVSQLGMHTTDRFC